MADIGGIFNSLLTINDGDRVIANITANAGVTFVNGANLLWAGNFSMIMNGLITTTPTGAPVISESEVSNPSQLEYIGFIIGNVTAGSNFENVIVRHAATCLSWTSAMVADNIVVNNVVGEKGRNRYLFSQTVAINVGEIMREDSSNGAAIEFLPTADVTISRFVDRKSSASTSSLSWMSMNSSSKLRIDELILDGIVSDSTIIRRSGGSPTLDIGRIFTNGQQVANVFISFNSGTLQVGGGIITVGKNRVSLFCLGAQNLIQGVDYYNQGAQNFHVQGPPEDDCTYHGAANKSIDGFNFIADTGTPNGVEDVSTTPFFQDAISNVSLVDHYPESPPVLVAATPGLDSVSVEFTVRTPGRSRIIFSDSVTPLIVGQIGDLAQYNFANATDYEQLIDQNGTGKTITSNIETGNRTIQSALPGGGELRGRIVHETFRTGKLFFSSEFTVTPTGGIVPDSDPPTWDTTTGVQTLVGLGSSLTANWGNASDLLSVPVQYNVYIRPDQAPDAFGPASPYLLKRVRELQTTIFTEANNVTLLDKNTTYHVVVRAVDNQGNEDLNTVSLSTTPALSPIAGNSLQGIIKIIQDRWSTLIEVAESLPTSYQNVPFTKPADSIWCELQVRPGIGRPTAIGGVTRIRRRVTGLVFVQIFFPLFLTTNEGWLTADKIVAAFSELSDRKITFQTPSTDDAGASDEHPGFWQINVSCPWFTDSINN